MINDEPANISECSLIYENYFLFSRKDAKIVKAQQAFVSY